MYKRIDIMIPNMLYKWHIYIRLLFIYQEHEHHMLVQKRSKVVNFGTSLDKWLSLNWYEVLK